MKKILIYSILLFALCSCDNFLEEDPRGKLTPSSFFSSPEDLDMAITGMYNKYYQTNARVFRAIYVWCADDVTAHSGGNKSRFSEYDRFNFNSGNTDILEMYQLYYQTIKACNYVINNAERTPVEKSFLEPRLGQAYFLRALNYFMLVRIWGRIPLVTENEINYNTPKAEVNKIYELIESDALTAERMLPDNHKIAPYFQNGINVAPNKGAAKALLASVYMTEAGWPLKKGAEYYDKAAAKYKEIIENEDTYGYILEPDIRTLTKEPEANYSKEIVFGEFHNKTKNYFSGPKSELPEESGGWCDYMVELEFFKSMPEGIRKDAWFLTKVTMTGQERNPETGRYPLLNWDDPATNLHIPAEKGERVLISEVFALSQKGDPLCVALVENASEALANLIMNLVRVTDPDTVVLGGGIVSDGYIHEKILEKLHPTTMRFVTNGVVITKLNPGFIGLLGAGAVAMNM